MESKNQETNSEDVKHPQFKIKLERAYVYTTTRNNKKEVKKDISKNVYYPFE